MAKPAPHGHLVKRKKTRRKKWRQYCFLMSTCNCYSGFRKMPMIIYIYKRLFQSPSHQLFVTWNFLMLLVKMVFFFCLPFYAGICDHGWKSWLGILFTLHFRSSCSLRTDKPGWNLTFFRLAISHAQLATLSTLTHAWLRQKYFFWKDEKNVPTPKCTYLLTKLSQRWGEMSFPVSPNQIIFFIFPFSFFFNFLSLAVQPPLHEKTFFVSVFQSVKRR